jgi:hypothetical protein
MAHYKPDIHAVKRRRRKGRVFRKRGIQILTSDRIGIDSKANPARNAQNEHPESDNMHLLKEEEPFLERSNKELEMWREISNGLHDPAE